jgi:hypothetical protein
MGQFAYTKCPPEVLVFCACFLVFPAVPPADGCPFLLDAMYLPKTSLSSFFSLHLSHGLRK